MDEEEEDELDELSEEEEEEEEEEDVEDEIDEEQENNLFLEEQSVEVDAPFAPEEEAREALELAKALGLDSTDSALERMGNIEKRFTSTLNKYGELISQEAEVAQLYDDLTSQIERLRASVTRGLQKMTEALEIKTAGDGLAAVRTQMEHFLRTVVERAILHGEYREAQEMEPNDVTSSLTLLGRSIPSQLSLLMAKDLADDEEQDGDFVPMEEEDMDEEEEMEENEKPTEETQASQEFWLESTSFNELVNIANSSELKIREDTYVVIQAAIEEFVLQLLRASVNVSHYNGRREVLSQDIQFAITMNKMY